MFDWLGIDLNISLNFMIIAFVSTVVIPADLERNRSMFHDDVSYVETSPNSGLITYKNLQELGGSFEADMQSKLPEKHIDQQTPVIDFSRMVNRDGIFPDQSLVISSDDAGNFDSLFLSVMRRAFWIKSKDKKSLDLLMGLKNQTSKQVAHRIESIQRKSMMAQLQKHTVRCQNEVNGCIEQLSQDEFVLQQLQQKTTENMKRNITKATMVAALGVGISLHSQSKVALYATVAGYGLCLWSSWLAYDDEQFKHTCNITMLQSTVKKQRQILSDLECSDVPAKYIDIFLQQSVYETMSSFNQENRKLYWEEISLMNLTKQSQKHVGVCEHRRRVFIMEQEQKEREKIITEHENILIDIHNDHVQKQKAIVNQGKSLVKLTSVVASYVSRFFKRR